MTDRIHPMHQSVYQHPSAPPLDGSTVAAPMPEKVIRKEQEEGSISQYEHAHTRQKDDHIYAAPPPVYQSYGEKGHTQGYAMAVAGPGQRRRRQRSRCCCCLISFVVTLGVLILIAGVAALVVYLVVRPVKEPKYVIEGVDVREFNMTNGGEKELNTEMNLRVEARNGNKKIGIDYDEIEVKMFYMEEEIGEGSIPGFYQGHRNTKLLTIPIQGEGVTLTSAATSSLQSSLESDASMTLAAKGRAEARIKIGRWKSRRHTFHVICSLQLSSRNLTLLSTSCHLKKRKFFFIRSLFFGS